MRCTNGMPQWRQFCDRIGSSHGHEGDETTGDGAAFVFLVTRALIRPGWSMFRPSLAYAQARSHPFLAPSAQRLFHRLARAMHCPE